MAAINVYMLDDCDWWAGESLAACVEEAQRQCGKDCYDDPADYSEVSDDAMQRLTFTDEDGSTRTFAEELKRRVDAGEEFPQLFASTEW